MNIDEIEHAMVAKVNSAARGSVAPVETKPLTLRFNANVLCAAERSAGKSLVEILDELASEAGASLTTLRALVAAGRQGAMYPTMPVLYIDEPAAGRLIDEHGTTASAEAVGKAFKEYFARSAA